MFTCCLRLALMVNEDTPMSYLPPWTPVMMVSKRAGLYSTVTPNYAATALKMSTSMPTAVLPPCRNSFGGYVESVPTTILPAALILAGRAALRSGPEDPAVVGAVLVGASLDGVLPPESSFDPQPVAASSSALHSASVVRRIDMFRTSVTGVDSRFSDRILAQQATCCRVSAGMKRDRCRPSPRGVECEGSHTRPVMRVVQSCPRVTPEQQRRCSTAPGSITACTCDVHFRTVVPRVAGR